MIKTLANTFYVKKFFLGNSPLKTSKPPENIAAPNRNEQGAKMDINKVLEGYNKTLNQYIQDLKQLKQDAESEQGKKESNKGEVNKWNNAVGVHNHAIAASNLKIQNYDKTITELSQNIVTLTGEKVKLESEHANIVSQEDGLRSEVQSLGASVRSLEKAIANAKKDSWVNAFKGGLLGTGSGVLGLEVELSNKISELNTKKAELNKKIEERKQKETEIKNKEQEIENKQEEKKKNIANKTKEENKLKEEVEKKDHAEKMQRTHEANVKQSEMAIATINDKIASTNESIALTNNKKREAVTNHQAYLKQQKEKYEQEGKRLQESIDGADSFLNAIRKGQDPKNIEVHQNRELYSFLKNNPTLQAAVYKVFQDQNLTPEQKRQNVDRMVSDFQNKQKNNKNNNNKNVSSIVGELNYLNNTYNKTSQSAEEKGSGGNDNTSQIQKARTISPAAKEESQKPKSSTSGDSKSVAKADSSKLVASISGDSKSVAKTESIQSEASKPEVKTESPKTEAPTLGGLKTEHTTESPISVSQNPAIKAEPQRLINQPAVINSVNQSENQVSTIRVDPQNPTNQADVSNVSGLFKGAFKGVFTGYPKGERSIPRDALLNTANKQWRVGLSQINTDNGLKEESTKNTSQKAENTIQGKSQDKINILKVSQNKNKESSIGKRGIVSQTDSDNSSGQKGTEIGDSSDESSSSNEGVSIHPDVVAMSNRVIQEREFKEIARALQIIEPIIKRSELFTRGEKKALQSQISEFLESYNAGRVTAEEVKPIKEAITKVILLDVFQTMKMRYANIQALSKEQQDLLIRDLNQFAQFVLGKSSQGKIADQSQNTEIYSRVHGPAVQSTSPDKGSQVRTDAAVVPGSDIPIRTVWTNVTPIPGSDILRITARTDVTPTPGSNISRITAGTDVTPTPGSNISRITAGTDVTPIPGSDMGTQNEQSSSEVDVDDFFELNLFKGIDKERDLINALQNVDYTEVVNKFGGYTSEETKSLIDPNLQKTISLANAAKKLESKTDFSSKDIKAIEDRWKDFSGNYAETNQNTESGGMSPKEANSNGQEGSRFDKISSRLQSFDQLFNEIYPMGRVIINGKEVDVAAPRTREEFMAAYERGEVIQIPILENMAQNDKEKKENPLTAQKTNAGAITSYKGNKFPIPSSRDDFSLIRMQIKMINHPFLKNLMEVDYMKGLFKFEKAFSEEYRSMHPEDEHWRFYQVVLSNIATAADIPELHAKDSHEVEKLISKLENPDFLIPIENKLRHKKILFDSDGNVTPESIDRLFLLKNNNKNKPQDDMSGIKNREDLVDNKDKTLDKSIKNAPSKTTEEVPDKSTNMNNSGIIHDDKKIKQNN